MFNNLRFGDFISIELKLKNYNEFNMFHVQCEVYVMLNNPDYEKFDILVEEAMENISIKEVVLKFDNFIKWRKYIYSKYESYFGTPSEKEEDEGFTFEKRFDTNTWQWHMMTDKLVKELNMKPAEVWDLKVEEALQWLMMYKEKEEYIDYINKKTRMR